MIRITDAGVRSTVQDRGRFGHLRSGVPPAGAADPFALAAANALVGNADDAAGIEIIVRRSASRATTARRPLPGVMLARDALAFARVVSIFVRAGQVVTVPPVSGRAQHISP